MKQRGPLLDMIGKPIVPGRGSHVGVTILTKDDETMAKAESDGKYTLNGHQFRIRKGDVLPDGAEFVSVDRAAEPEERAKVSPPEDKAKADKPENKAKA